jgi:hypothetical protein
MFEYVDMLSDKARMIFIFHKQEDFSLTHMAAVLENLCQYTKGDDCVFQGNFAVVGRNIFFLYYLQVGPKLCTYLYSQT